MLESLVTGHAAAPITAFSARIYVPNIGRVTVAFPGMADEDTSLVGREEELSRLRCLVASPYTESRVLLLLGDPGMGKTVLLAEAALERSSAPAQLIDQMTAAYPDLANPYTLWVAAYDLLGTPTR